MGEIEVMQPLPVLRIERLVPHLLQQRIELCRGADRRRLRVASRRVQVSHDNGSHARLPASSDQYCDRPITRVPT